MDTKYFADALLEFNHPLLANRRIGDLTLPELSLILRRAQELKDADRMRQNALNKMGDYAELT